MKSIAQLDAMDQHRLPRDSELRIGFDLAKSGEDLSCETIFKPRIDGTFELLSRRFFKGRGGIFWKQDPITRETTYSNTTTSTLDFPTLQRSMRATMRLLRKEKLIRALTGSELDRVEYLIRRGSQRREYELFAFGQTKLEINARYLGILANQLRRLNRIAGTL